MPKRLPVQFLCVNCFRKFSYKAMRSARCIVPTLKAFRNLKETEHKICFCCDKIAKYVIVGVIPKKLHEIVSSVPDREIAEDNEAEPCFTPKLKKMIKPYIAEMKRTGLIRSESDLE